MPKKARSLAQVKKTKVLSFSGGSVSFLHDDVLTTKLREALNADSRITRASNVEPSEDGLTWVVDLAPVNGPKKGGFKTRDEGIAFEVEWIQKNVLGGK